MLLPARASAALFQEVSIERPNGFAKLFLIVFVPTKRYRTRNLEKQNGIQRLVLTGGGGKGLRLIRKSSVAPEKEEASFLCRSLVAQK